MTIRKILSTAGFLVLALILDPPGIAMAGGNVPEDAEEDGAPVVEERRKIGAGWIVAGIILTAIVIGSGGSDNCVQPEPEPEPRCR